MSVIDTIRAALYGNPPQPGFKPSRDGVLAAFSELALSIDGLDFGIEPYATTALRDAATGVTAGTISYVYANNGSPSDPANGFYQYNGSAWVAAVWLNNIITSEVDAQYSALTNPLVRNISFSHGAPYIDGATLRWPAFYERSSVGAYAERAPSSGQKWFETGVPVELFQGSFYVYYDSTDNTIKTQSVYTAMGTVGSDAKPVIGYVSAGHLIGPTPLAELLANDFDANAVGCPTVMGADTFMRRTIAIGELAALGIFLGYGSGDQITAGGMFDRPEGQYAFARVFVYDNDASPGVPIVPFFQHFTPAYLTNPATGLTFRGDGILEKIYSSRLRSYIIDTRPRSTDMAGMLANINTGGRDIILCGLQLAATNNSAAVIPVVEMASKPHGDEFGHVFFPPELAIFADRPIKLYPTSFISRRPMIVDHVSLSRDSETGATNPVGASGRFSVPVDPANIVNNEMLTLSRHFDWPLRDQIQFCSVRARKIIGADLAGKTIDLMFIGDSKVDDTVTAGVVETVLEGYGATVNRFGTLTGDGGALHEGRSGRSLSDYVGRDRTHMAYVANPADYIAAPNFPNRYNMNPFLFTGSGAGSYDGYRFDFGAYLTAYSIAAPDVAVIDLLTNDFDDWDDLGAFTEFVDVATTRMITSIRASGTKVLFALAGLGWSDYWSEVWTRSAPAALRGLMRAIGRFNDPLNVRLSSTYAQMSPFAFGAYTATSTDSDTGLQFGTLTDFTHPKLEVRTQGAIAVAADVGAMIR